MNPDNYGSLEACQRLQAAGVVVETEKFWYLRKHDNKWVCTSAIPQKTEYLECIPALSMAEAWRMLPEVFNGMTLKMRKSGDNTEVAYDSHGPYQLSISTNPVDALIDLIIWLEGRREKP
jgi:hypothetical protein